MGNVDARLVRSGPELREDVALVFGGVLGYRMPRVRPATMALERGDLLVMITDGIDSAISPHFQAAVPAQALASRISTRHGKGNDDALAVVIRYRYFDETGCIASTRQFWHIGGHVHPRTSQTRNRYVPTQRASTIRLRTSLFQEAAEIVDREYASDLSLDDIARRVASSRRQLQRAYAEIGETTFRDHLTRVRMQKAAEMLATRALTVREVAHRVGYRQPAQFAKAFRRYQGVAPSDFRANGRAPVRPPGTQFSARPRTAQRKRSSAVATAWLTRSSARSHRMPPPWALRRGLRPSGLGPTVRMLAPTGGRCSPSASSRPRSVSPPVC